mgnify:CR=1 FL=1
MPHTRRSFLGRLARGLIATTIALELGAKLSPKAEAQLATLKGQKWDVNPQWVNAPYEVEIRMSHFALDPHPLRHVWSDELGIYIPWYDEAWDLVPWRIVKHSRAQA